MTAKLSFLNFMLATFTLVLATPSMSQVTLQQLDQAVAEASDGLEAFRARLQDPDPARARAAMRLLIAQGDDAQRRLAIEHGFGATDPVMRMEAVRGILDAEPLLLFRWTPESEKVNNNYLNTVTRNDGILENGNVARVPVKVGKYSQEEQCWTYEASGNCFARVNSGELGVRFTGKWAQFILDEEGKLVGRANISGHMVSAVADLLK